jgi:hypothetical protein
VPSCTSPCETAKRSHNRGVGAMNTTTELTELQHNVYCVRRLRSLAAETMRGMCVCVREGARMRHKMRTFDTLPTTPALVQEREKQKPPPHLIRLSRVRVLGAAHRPHKTMVRFQYPWATKPTTPMYSTTYVQQFCQISPSKSMRNFVKFMKV